MGKLTAADIKVRVQTAFHLSHVSDMEIYTRYINEQIASNRTHIAVSEITTAIVHARQSVNDMRRMRVELTMTDKIVCDKVGWEQSIIACEELIKESLCYLLELERDVCSIAICN